MNKSKTVLSVLLSAFLSGCGLYSTPAPPPSGHFYLNPRRPISAVGKVAIVEMDNYSAHPQVSVDFTEALCQALAERHLFGVEAVYRADPAYNRLQLDRTEPFTMEWLAAIRETLKVDAVLLGAITQYRPYPHMTAGVRVRLIDLQDGQLLWAVQQVWDSSDKAVEARMRGFFRTRMRDGYEPLGWELAVISPRHFHKFVAYETARTLP